MGCSATPRRFFCNPSWWYFLLLFLTQLLCSSQFSSDQQSQCAGLSNSYVFTAVQSLFRLSEPLSPIVYYTSPVPSLQSFIAIIPGNFSDFQPAPLKSLFFPYFAPETRLFSNYSKNSAVSSIFPDTKTDNRGSRSSPLRAA